MSPHPDARVGFDTFEGQGDKMRNTPHVAAVLGDAIGVGLLDHPLAYIGPGAGLGGIAIAIALVLGVLFLVIGLVWYPLKRFLRTRTGNAASGSRPDEPE